MFIIGKKVIFFFLVIKQSKDYVQRSRLLTHTNPALGRLKEKDSSPRLYKKTLFKRKGKRKGWEKGKTEEGARKNDRKSPPL